MAVPPSQHLSIYLNTHRDTVGEGQWLRVGQTLPGGPACCRGLAEGWRPLEEGAGTLWGWRGCVRGAVTHWKYVVVAGHVGATRNVIGVLGEAGGHSIGPLQDTHCWLCSSPGQKEENIGRGTLGIQWL